MTTATGPLARLSGSVPTVVIGTSAVLGTPRSSRTMTPSLSYLIATEQCGGAATTARCSTSKAFWGEVGSGARQQHGAERKHGPSPGCLVSRSYERRLEGVNQSGDPAEARDVIIEHMFVRIDPRCKREKAQAESRRELHDAPAPRVKNSRFAGISGDGGGRDRTCDLELRRLLLYPLSYAPRFRSTVPVFPNRAARPFWGFWMRVESAARESLHCRAVPPRTVVAKTGRSIQERSGRKPVAQITARRRRQLAPRMHDRPWGAGLSPWRNRTMSNVRYGPRHEHRPRHHGPRYHQGHLATSSQPANLVPQHRCQPSRQRQQGYTVDDVHAPHLRSILRVADDVGHESIAAIISHRGQAQPAHHTQWPARRAAPTGRAHKLPDQRFAMTTLQRRTSGLG
jgi:hypothetical protein